MKPAKILLMLAALAGVSASATTVSFTGSTAAGALTQTVAPVTLTGYIRSTVPTVNWNQQFVTLDSTLGAAVQSTFGDPNRTEGTWGEYIVLDFGATASGTVKIDNLVLNFANSPGSPNFRYQWISALPSGANPTLGLTDVNSASSGTPPGDLTYSSISGSGRYFLIGAVNGTLSSANMFSVKSVDYTSVPDGASTLALMGAAVATLGFAARRRRA
jgi:hypothetical protein